jgi:hypothetical protein
VVDHAVPVGIRFRLLLVDVAQVRHRRSSDAQRRCVRSLVNEVDAVDVVRNEGLQFFHQSHRFSINLGYYENLARSFLNPFQIISV